MGFWKPPLAERAGCVLTFYLVVGTVLGLLGLLLPSDCGGSR